MDEILEQEKMKSDEDLSKICDEIRRQFDYVWRGSDSNSSKAGILLGFVVVILIQVALSRLFSDLIPQASPILLILAAGYLSVLASGFFCVSAFKFKKYHVGPEIDDLVKLYRKGEKANYEQRICRRIQDSMKENRELSKAIASDLKAAMYFLMAGMLLIVLSAIAYWWFN